MHSLLRLLVRAAATAKRISKLTRRLPRYPPLAADDRNQQDGADESDQSPRDPLPHLKVGLARERDAGRPHDYECTQSEETRVLTGIGHPQRLAGLFPTLWLGARTSSLTANPPVSDMCYLPKIRKTGKLALPPEACTRIQPVGIL